VPCATGPVEHPDYVQ